MSKVEELNKKGFLVIVLEVKIWQMVSYWTYSQQESHGGGGVWMDNAGKNRKQMKKGMK